MRSASSGSAYRRARSRRNSGAACTPTSSVCSTRTRNARKLRRGALLGNNASASACARSSWPREALEEKLAALRTHGAPNYFGPQRFGRDGFNLDRVAEWLQSGQRPAGRGRARVCALGGARAAVQCGARAPRAERRLVAARAGRSGESRRQRQPFSIDAVDSEIERRLDTFDIHPSGPAVGPRRAAEPGHALRDRA